MTEKREYPSLIGVGVCQECIKDGKVILSSDEPIEMDSIADFKARVKLLIICDKVNVEFEKI